MLKGAVSTLQQPREQGPLAERRGGRGGGRGLGFWKTLGMGAEVGRTGLGTLPLPLNSEPPFSDLILPKGTHTPPYDLSVTTLAGTLDGKE